MNNLEKRWKEGDLKLFPHQLEGIAEIECWLRNGHGGICADEMGLGKTALVSVILTRLHAKKKGPFFVLSPLSVCDHWEKEVTRFSGGRLKPFKFVGNLEARQELLNAAEFDTSTVFITAAHILRQRSTLQLLQRTQRGFRPFTTFVIDEAQCVKTPGCQLSHCVQSLVREDPSFILLTGTPIQNSLHELYSLLNICDSEVFPMKQIDAFAEKYTDSASMEQLRGLLKKYMFRRTKEEVFKQELKECQQVILFHGISELQKTVYKDIISKNAGILREKGIRASLVNVLVEIRKCIVHPYIIRGVEPQPFEEGEHIVEASMKLQVLDRLLAYTTPRGHRCLIFTQFLGSLDILEDFMIMRDIPYVRIDGQTTVEDRVESIIEFQEAKEGGPVCFLLSTKAAGVGLTLTAADTAIFFDSDWNPQNDIQAMARCHRIGQDKVVRVIRLVAKSTIDHNMVARARDKLKLTEAIIGNTLTKVQASDIVTSLREKFGELMESDSSKFECTDEELERMIGKSEDGGWLPVSKSSDVVLFLDPDQIDEQIDKKDYTQYEGVSHRDKTYTDIWDQIVSGTYVVTSRRRERDVAYQEGFPKNDGDEDEWDESGPTNSEEGSKTMPTLSPEEDKKTTTDQKPKPRQIPHCRLCGKVMKGIAKHLQSEHGYTDVMVSEYKKQKKKNEPLPAADEEPIKYEPPLITLADSPDDTPKKRPRTKKALPTASPALKRKPATPLNSGPATIPFRDQPNGVIPTSPIDQVAKGILAWVRNDQQG